MKISKKAMAEIIKAAEGIMERGIEAMGEQKEERIPCPIQMVKDSLIGGDGLGIPFPDGNRMLFYWDAYEDYVVMGFKKHYLVDCVLVPCRKEDLKEGDTAFRTDLDAPDFNRLWGYCKIKKHNIHIYIVSSGGIGEPDTGWDNWYKVVQA